jgi:SAM-dependent methyltransferase/ElaB/YqjD/DUF883 family membrane-anchored ribosome-binding protein
LKPQRPKSATNITIKQNKPIKQKGDFYRAFEDVYRGTREEIKERLRVYLPFALHCQELYDECKILDLGCGRGEWLELMSENGFKAFGVDLDDGMLDACREKALHAEKKDALATLEQMPDESLVIVSGFHIAEHLSFTILQGVVEQSLRVLKPGGLLILETPNPENILVGAMSFYLDPTHLRPLPPQLLSFLPVFYGFERTKILRLQDSPKLRGSEKITILDVLSETSPDYAVIAQKKAGIKRMALFDDVFKKEYGLTLETLGNSYEKSLSKEIETAVETMDGIMALNMGQVREEIGGRVSEIWAHLIESGKASGEGLEALRLKSEDTVERIKQETEARISQINENFSVFETAIEAVEGSIAANIEEVREEVGGHVSEIWAHLIESGKASGEELEALRLKSEETAERIKQETEARLSEIKGNLAVLETAIEAVEGSMARNMGQVREEIGGHVSEIWAHLTESGKASGEELEALRLKSEDTAERIKQETEARISQINENLSVFESAIEAVEGKIAANIEEIRKEVGGHVSEIWAHLIESGKLSEERFAAFELRAMERIERERKEFAARTDELETRNQQMEQAFHSIRESRSWRMTAPCRFAGDAARKGWSGFKNIMKPGVEKLILFVQHQPSLRKRVLPVINHFPRCKERIKKFALSRGLIENTLPVPLFTENVQPVKEQGGGLSVDEILLRIRNELADNGMDREGLR